MNTDTPKSALPRVYAWFSGVIHNDTDALAELLAHGLPVDVQHPLRHTTALMEAVRLGRAPLVVWLLGQGAAPAQLCGIPKGTPIHCAIGLRRWAVAELLLASMAEVTAVDGNGRTPLHLLCAETTEDSLGMEGLTVAEAMIAKHCPLDALDQEGISALHHSVINSQRALAELLLTSGASPNVLIPESKVSPLFIAAIERNTAIAALLIQHGADPTLATRDGATAVEFMPALTRMDKDSSLVKALSSED